jgi:AAA15 family ATPase/GTPase
MIIEFEIGNFGPIREPQKISFEATSDDHLSEYYIVEPIPGLKLLKLLVIYGPNASGKSTLLEAIEFLRELSLNPVSDKNDELAFQPFLFDLASKSEKSSIQIAFLINKVRYNYSVEFTQQYILNEKLQYYPKNRVADFYTRTTDIENKVSKISFGGTLKVNNKELAVIEGNTLWNNTVLGAFNKTNVNIPALNTIINWFNETLMSSIRPTTNLFNWTSDKIQDDSNFKKGILELLKKADVQIDDIDIKTTQRDLDDETLNRLAAWSISEKQKKQLLKDKKITTRDIFFKHTVKEDGKSTSYELINNMESRGTLRYYGLSGILNTLINAKKIITIDELETSLHPELMKHFVLVYLANSTSSQLMITTHSLSLLEDKDIIRNDAIWFTEKKENGTTDLYSLADFDTSIIRKGSSIINSYKTGKLGAKPDLGSIFISKNNG